MNRKKMIIILLVGLFLCLAFGTAFFFLRKSRESGETVPNDNQRIVYGYLTSIQGNEISYREMDSDVVEAMAERSREKQEMTDIEKESDDNAATKGNAEAISESGNRNRKNMAQGETPPSMDWNSDNAGESVTTLIPVGTVVHTTTDTETTFSRLASGDLVKLLLETDSAGEEIIVEIWMVQQ